MFSKVIKWKNIDVNQSYIVTAISKTSTLIILRNDEYEKLNMYVSHLCPSSTLLPKKKSTINTF